MARILLVEDNEMNRDMLQRRLQRRGHEVSVAVDGAESVEKAKAELPELILMDISLPVMDGYEATRILKANPSTRSIPILGLSAHAMSGDAEKALQAGCDDYDTKPVDLRRMLRKVEDLLRKHPQSSASSPAVQDASVQAEPVQAEPVQDEPIQAEPIQAEPLRAESSQQAPIREEPNQPQPAPPAVPNPASFETVNLDTARSTGPSTGPSTGRAAQPTPWLLIQDDALRADTVRQLGELGHGAQTCLDANEVLAAVARGQVSALLVDPRGDVDAENLIRQARRLSGRSLRILIVSSVDSLQMAFRCLDAGADFFLPAPFTNHLLHSRLSEEAPPA